jgi:ketosteroid isomerase-like protein
MKSHLSMFTAAIVLVSAFVAPRFAAPNDSANVRAAVLGFPTAWNHHDMVAFGKLFAPDAEFVNVRGRLWKGREAIQINHAWSHGTISANTKGFESADEQAHYSIFKNSTMRFPQIEVRFLRDDIAVAHVNWELFGDARTKEPRRGVLVFVLSRHGDKWLIDVAQNTEIARKVK